MTNQGRNSVRPEREPRSMTNETQDHDDANGKQMTESRSDFLIIGGGIVGASIAYHLSSRTDQSVTLLERQAPASETTYKSVAMTGLYGDSTQYRMKQYAHRLYNQFFENPRANPRYNFAGRLVVATEKETAKKLRKAVDGDPSVGKIGMNAEEALMEYIPGDKITSNLMVPGLSVEKIHGALYRPKMGYMSFPQELTYEFLERAKEQGAEVRVNTPVREITTNGSTVTGVETNDGFIESSHVISAAGPWNLEITRELGLNYPIKHTLAPALQLEPDRPIRHSLPSIEPFESPYSIHRRSPKEVLLSYYPGSYQEAGMEYDPSTVSDSVPKEIRNGAIETVESLMPSLLDADIVEEWVGVRSMTPDYNPIAGWTAIEGFSIAAFNTSGIQLAPAVGDMISRQLLDGDPTEYYDSLSVTRFDGYSDVQGSS